MSIAIRRKTPGRTNGSSNQSRTAAQRNRFPNFITTRRLSEPTLPEFVSRSHHCQARIDAWNRFVSNKVFINLLRLYNIMFRAADERSGLFPGVDSERDSIGAMTVIVAAPPAEEERPFGDGFLREISSDFRDKSPMSSLR